jgi:RimJ/RimL family protein N-acetyltransferase
MPSQRIVTRGRGGERLFSLSGSPLRALRCGRYRANEEADVRHLTDTVVLADATRVEVRSIRPGDASELTAMHARLSDVSIYRRYFRVLPELSDVVAARLTTLEELWRFALVAVDARGRVVAVARYEGARGDHSAELALVVDDAVQRSGLGSAMLERLCDVAQLRGLHLLVAEVLDSNIGMLRLLKRLPFPTSFARESDVVTVTISVESGLSEPSRVARALAHSGAVVDPAASSP